MAVGDRGSILTTADSDAPLVTVPNVVVANGGAAISFSVTTDASAVSVANLPEWLSFNTATGVFGGVAPVVNSVTLLAVTAAAPLARTMGSFELIVPKTYAAWSQAYFGEPNRPADEDADGDGATNIFEYAFATNPRTITPGTSLASFAFIQGTPTFTFPRDASVVDRIFEVQASSNLSSWTVVARSASNGHVVSIDPAFTVDEAGLGMVRSVRVMMNPPVGPLLFMRLRLLTP